MKKICVVQSTYCSEVTDKIFDTSVKILKASSKDFDSYKVTGSFEIPVTISRLIEKYEGFVAIGCIIKGETKNFEFISSAITNSIMQLSIQYKKPIGNAILTCLNKEQAISRINKGEEASKAVLDILKNVPI